MVSDGEVGAALAGGAAGEGAGAGEGCEHAAALAKAVSAAAWRCREERFTSPLNHDPVAAWASACATPGSLHGPQGIPSLPSPPGRERSRWSAAAAKPDISPFRPRIRLGPKSGAAVRAGSVNGPQGRLLLPSAGHGRSSGAISRAQAARDSQPQAQGWECAALSGRSRTHRATPGAALR